MEKAALRFGQKGTGDGVMIVSQADWYKNAVPNDKRDTLASGHARDFLDACDRSVKAWQQQFGFRFPLAIGCGIGSGELHRVFLFGRLDFIGPAANEAAKLQQHAWNEICVTPTFADALRKDGRVFGEGDRELPAKGWRLHSR
jgi:class 3 adenylate cyclase